MEKAAERKLAQAAGQAVEEPIRARHGTRSFGSACFACYYDMPWAGLIREKEAEVIAEALFSRGGCEPAGKEGRGELLRFPLADGHGLLRTFRRGGLARLLWHDAYLLQNRPYRELRIQSTLYDRGFPVPEPLGVVWRRSRVLYRGAIASREVDGQDLYHYLSTAPADADGTMERVGALIRRMHDLGVYHADLQVRNLLVGKDGLYVIDFDKASLHRSLPARLRARNLFRFRRSLRKNGFPPRYFDCLLNGYGEVTLSRGLSVLYRLKGLGSDLLGGRAPHG
ncbi:MAG: lipopolysaccharide kinase InaA family protein [FCB group bacterium]|nr:lipopolysaccharide kinase InaA family protein [FCB group bacterium]